MILANKMLIYSFVHEGGSYVIESICKTATKAAKHRADRFR